MVAKSNTIEGANSSPYTIGRKNVKNTIMLFVKDQNLVTLNSGTYSNNVGILLCFLTVPCVGLSIGILSDPLVYHFIGYGSLKNVLLRKLHTITRTTSYICWPGQYKNVDKRLQWANKL